MPGLYAPEPRYYGQPLGVWVERFLGGFLTFSLYLAVTYASDFFPHLLTLNVAGSDVDMKCPRGYGVASHGSLLVCKAKLAIAVDAAGPLTKLFDITAGVGLVHVLVRKARDAGVTFTLPWSPSPSRNVTRPVGDAEQDDARGNRGERPPTMETPWHSWLAWWIEPVLIAHACASLFICLALFLRLVTHPRRLPRQLAHCPLSSIPQWVWFYNDVETACAYTPSALLLCFLEIFNALVAAALNALAALLTRQRRAEEDRRW